jgi:hypothetical protein
MKIAYRIILALCLAVFALWLLTWTPLFQYMPQVIKQLMFGFGGLITLMVLLAVVLVVVLLISKLPPEKDNKPYS